MSTELTDTEPEAERVMLEITRRTPVWQKLAQVSALTEACRRLALADIRRAHPHADADELRRLLAARLLPPELAARVEAALAERTRG